jgi:endonuclease/exonuclease/phosphatase family metal-dependent hydrolase
MNPSNPSTYESTQGLLMLSKEEMSKKEKTVLTARGALEAKVKGLGTVVCAHLMPSEVPAYDVYGNEYTDSGPLLEAEIEKLNQKADIWLGDFNIDPEVEQENPALYDLIESFGFTEKMEDGTLGDVSCTYCLENFLAVIGFDTDNELYQPNNLAIDHVFVKEKKFVVHDVRYELNEGTGIPLSAEVTNLPLSDHYAVTVDICKD